jgi:hypothetical protein
MKYNRSSAICLSLLIAGCSGGSMDIHDVDREPKAYESVQVGQLGTEALINHLLEIADEMTAATAEGAYVEMHHLEIALTKAIAELEGKLPDGSAKSTIDTLRIVAIRIHEAGHDQNGTMAKKLDQTLREKILQLKAELP